MFAYRIIPNNSQVFEVIKKDDFNNLRKLLENDTATTRDCDEENRSLLHVSQSYKIPHTKADFGSTPVDIRASSAVNISYRGVPTLRGSAWFCKSYLTMLADGRLAHTRFLLHPGLLFAETPILTVSPFLLINFNMDT